VNTLNAQIRINIYQTHRNVFCQYEVLPGQTGQQCIYYNWLSGNTSVRIFSLHYYQYKDMSACNDNTWDCVQVVASVWCYKNDDTPFKRYMISNHWTRSCAIIISLLEWLPILAWIRNMKLHFTGKMTTIQLNGLVSSATIWQPILV
jgi:hypothetical protein